MKRKITNSLIVISFLAVFVLPIAAADKVGGGLSPTENRYRAKFPDLFDENKAINSEFLTGFEKWMKDNLAGRMRAQNLKGFIDYYVFNISPSPRVRLGYEDWYFYTSEQNIEIGLGMRLLSNEELSAIADNQTWIMESLKELGIDYVLVLAPSKASVYPEFLDPGWEHRKSNYTMIDQLTDYLTENTKVPVVNPKPQLLAGKAGNDVYFHTDTHWNYRGAYIGYMEVVRYLNESGLLNSQVASVSSSATERFGDLTNMMGDLNKGFLEQTEVTEIINPQATKVEGGEKIEQIRTMLDSKSINGEYFLFSNEAADTTVLIQGDSFFNSFYIRELFAENFGELNFIRSSSIDSDILSAIKPDLLIFELTERAIPNLSQTYYINLPNPLNGKSDSSNTGN
jgi:hypothetical protein